MASQITEGVGVGQEELIERAILYVRYSPKPKGLGVDETDTLEVQEDRLRRYCAMAGLAPDIILRDPGVSARKVSINDRPDGQQIRKLILGGVRHIVAQRIDRLFRDMVDGIETEEKWRKQGVKLHLADQGGVSLDCSTATGRMIFRTMLNISSFEAEMTAERVSCSHHYKQNNGKRISKQLRYGLMEDPSSDFNAEKGIHCGTMECPEEIKMIEVIMRYIQSPVAWSNRQIACTMNEWGHRCRGGKWNHKTIGKIIKRELKGR
jgi:DNA invertase Pin-like site-specific DNA recombinase